VCLLGTSLPFRLEAHKPASQEGDHASTTGPVDLSDLELDPARRLELEDAVKQRQYKRAEKLLVEEAEREPQSARSAKLLVAAGGIFFLDGEYLNSAIAWKKAEAIAPLDERTRFTLAMAYIKLNHRDWARKELEKLGAAQPHTALYLYWLARLDYDGQNYTSAINRLRQVVELDPKMTRAYDLLGLCYDYLGNLDQAMKAYERAVELNRSASKPSPWPHLDFAVSLIEANRLAEADRNLRQALTYDSRLPQAHYQLGRVLEMQNQHQSALQALKRAVELDSAYPEPHYLMGRIYQRIGEHALAQAEVQKFQELRSSAQDPPKANPASSSD
jgi:tetratricopeptide (TPR) repeat protein